MGLFQLTFEFHKVTWSIHLDDKHPLYKYYFYTKQQYVSFVLQCVLLTSPSSPLGFCKWKTTTWIDPYKWEYHEFSLVGKSLDPIKTWTRVSSKWVKLLFVVGWLIWVIRRRIDTNWSRWVRVLAIRDMLFLTTIFQSKIPLICLFLFIYFCFFFFLLYFFKKNK